VDPLKKKKKLRGQIFYGIVHCQFGYGVFYMTEGKHDHFENG
jgi:hypothetical protein